MNALNAASTATRIQTAVTNLGTALASLATTITDEAEHGFTLSLSPDRNIVQPDAPEVFDLVIDEQRQRGDDLRPERLGPARRGHVVVQRSVGDGPAWPDARRGLRGPDADLDRVWARWSRPISRSRSWPRGRRRSPEHARPAHPPHRVDPRGQYRTDTALHRRGRQVDVSAKIQAAVNEPTQVSASYTVTDPNGKILFTSTAVPVSLTDTTSVDTVDLGNVDTTGFANGTDTITVNLVERRIGHDPLVHRPAGDREPHDDPPVIPTGSDTVSTTVTVSTQATYPVPLTLQGGVTTPAPGTSVALYSRAARPTPTRAAPAASTTST